MSVTVFSPAYLADISREATQSPRRRMNRNLHQSPAEVCQRLFNAIEPESYIRPHRHSQPAIAETIIAVRGSFLLVSFDDLGGILEAQRFGAGASAEAAGLAVGVGVPPGCWHTVVSLEAGSVFFEAKPGPFDPTAPREFACWAPEEGDASAPAWLAALVAEAAARFA
jgi:cupin fold WbuC family metalloprotein